MSLLNGLSELFTISVDDERLLRAQMASMERQVPLLYVIVLVTTAGLGLHFYGRAPAYLTVTFPALVAVAIVARMLGWYFGRHRFMPLSTVKRKLRTLTILIAVVSVALCGWAALLDPYGSGAHRIHTMFYITVGSIATTLALVHFPPAAISAIISSGIGFAMYALTAGNVVLLGITVNILLVQLVMVALLKTSYGAFAENIRTQNALEEKNYEMLQLNEALRFHRDNLSDEVKRRTVELEEQAVALEKALSQEKELNQMQNQFVSMVSHEFRTPLTVIDATARRVRRNAETMPRSELPERMMRVESSVKRLSGLVERTLDASKFASGAIEFKPVQFSFLTLLNDVIERQKEVSPDANISVVRGEVVDQLTGDPHLIDHVLTNLLSNAAKYAKGKPVIEVDLSRQDGQLVLRVRDEGVGIPRSELPNIMQRFYRASTSSGIPGTGIGLNFVAGLVAMHGGAIEIDSEEGAWTEVTVRLPLAHAEEAETVDSRPSLQADLSR